MNRLNVDPFFPASYGGLRFPANAKEDVDQCLCHPQFSGTLHYHVASPCITDDVLTWTD